MNAPPYLIRTKIWIQNPDGKVVFGLGRYRILKAVQDTGSLQAAAKELKMSYRAVWMRIRASEKRIGRELVVRDGKGSRLTPFAENLMKQYKRLLAILEKESDEVYQHLMSDELI
ncbi:MAG: LysR family transcriptional regulator [Desulfobacterales bacterium]